MAETRIYIVVNTTTGTKHLVEASSQAQAIRHCVSTTYTADVATAKQFAHMMGEGLKIEKSDAVIAPRTRTTTIE